MRPRNEGYFGLVDIGARYDGPLTTVLNRDWKWMSDPAVRAGAVVALGGDIKGVPEWKMYQALPPLDPQYSSLRGEVVSESKEGETYSARLAILRPCYALLKITYFPGQQATVDGKPAPIFRVYPNFCAIPVGPGEHQIEVRYHPGPIKPILLIVGFILVGLIAQRMRKPGYAAMERKLSRAAVGIGDTLGHSTDADCPGARGPYTAIHARAVRRKPARRP